MDILEDIKSVTELKARTRKVLEHVRRTRRPMVITVKGKPSAVLIDAEEFQRRESVLRLAKLLAEGERDIAEGRVRPAADFVRELLGGRKKIPR